MKKYYITTFGCQANVADSERVAAMLENRGMVKAESTESANHIVINTCMIRQKAEDRVYGLVNNLSKRKRKEKDLKIVVTGCMVGMAVREKSGALLRKIKERMPAVDEFLPIEEVGFDNNPIRTNNVHAWVPISNGCNNFCTFCVVPFTRGREISRPFEDILTECKHLADRGFKEVTLIGQNVNSYGADLVAGKEYTLSSGRKVRPVYVKHLGRLRIPTLFPYLLDEVCKISGIEKVDFISSNPWDFSDELIDTITKNNKISRQLHIAVQSGDNTVLKRMNRWYTAEQFLVLVSKIKNKISNVNISTDIIVGFCGETKKQFENTVKLVKQAQFTKAYVAMYSDRPGTAAHKAYKDNVPYKTKKERWTIIENLINKPNLRKEEYKWKYA